MKHRNNVSDSAATIHYFFSFLHRRTLQQCSFTTSLLIAFIHLHLHTTNLSLWQRRYHCDMMNARANPMKVATDHCHHNFVTPPCQSSHPLSSSPSLVPPFAASLYSTTGHHQQEAMATRRCIVIILQQPLHHQLCEKLTHENESGRSNVKQSQPKLTLMDLNRLTQHGTHAPCVSDTIIINFIVVITVIINISPAHSLRWRHVAAVMASSIISHPTRQTSSAILIHLDISLTAVLFSMEARQK